ncbi:carbon-nitrogen hydrolase family protein [Desulfosarcina sp. OttesenSCG-928-A07]|nr:carbon-nitrogen hydrolase family protein [Desulfosarcina sp. OttesenSCG-928-G17]MDL2328917.1 carbon-nitrogen hydrolase family protein [Desulfosarcina sp. OttesenSCG-928-A07]
MPSFLVAAIQLNSQDRPEINMDTISTLTSDAAQNGAQMVALPESAHYLSDLHMAAHAESMDGPTLSIYRQLAKDHGIYFCGSFAERTNDPKRAFNTAVLISPEGEIIAVYRKIHLFDVAIGDAVDHMESRHTLPGDRSVVAKTPCGVMGLAICYDLRFPELFRQLGDKGADIIIIPAAFTLYTGKDHWEVLLRARAIENQVYVVAPAQWGPHPVNKTCFGNTMIIDPWGTVIARASEGPGYILAPVDTGRIIKVRSQLPCLQNRRFFN